MLNGTAFIGCINIVIEIFKYINKDNPTSISFRDIRSIGKYVQEKCNDGNQNYVIQTQGSSIKDMCFYYKDLLDMECINGTLYVKIKDRTLKQNTDCFEINNMLKAYVHDAVDKIIGNKDEGSL